MTGGCWIGCWRWGYATPFPPVILSLVVFHLFICCLLGWFASVVACTVPWMRIFQKGGGVGGEWERRGFCKTEWRGKEDSEKHGGDLAYRWDGCSSGVLRERRCPIGKLRLWRCLRNAVMKKKKIGSNDEFCLTSRFSSFPFFFRSGFFLKEEAEMQQQPCWQLSPVFTFYTSVWFTPPRSSGANGY